MAHEREIAGIGIVAGAVLLIYRGEYALAGTLLAGLVGFFTGENNGKKKAAQTT